MAAGSSSSAPVAPPSCEAITVDETLPQTTVQVRLQDGTRVRVTANHSHTVKQLHAHVASLTPNLAFELRAGFPPKSLAPQMDATLEQASLLSEAVVQAPL
eukprot:scaffold5969_cov103-Isochrysis_galbana.AAC.1